MLMLTERDLKAFSFHKIKKEKPNRLNVQFMEVERNADAFSVTSGCSSTVTTTTTIYQIE